VLCKIALLISCLSLAASLNASEINHDDIQRRIQSVYEKSAYLLDGSNTFTLPEANPYEGEYDERISAINQDKERIITGYLQGKGMEAKKSMQTDSGNLFVLVSFSMPDTLIKQYMNEAHRYRANVVIIGLVDNDFNITQSKIKEITGKTNKGGVLIDPNLFTTYNVQSVPAILLTADQYPCLATNCSSGNFDIMYGAVPVQYALESFQARGDLKEFASSRLEGKL
jgi:type-F conjugative transfer system pilin assembly protein TrbC